MSEDDSIDLDEIIQRLNTPNKAGAACQLGIMAWQEGHFESAVRLYEHSLTLFPQPATYFNLAVTYDDWGRKEEAVRALRDFYLTVASSAERAMVEEMLRDNGKAGLIQ